MVCARAGRRTRAGLGRVAHGGRGARAVDSPSSRHGPRSRPVPGPVRAVLALGQARQRTSTSVVHACRELGQRTGAAIGVSELHDSPADASRAYREALDAATIGRALLGDGGAIAYSQVGAYRYLVHIAAEDAPRDRMRAAVDVLIDYDRRRRTALLDTLERYLAERRSVIESARALFIHPNTLRQRLGRIEELTGLDSTRTTCCRSSSRSSSRGCTGARERATANPSRRRAPGTPAPCALRRTRWGSWDHIASATTGCDPGRRPSRSPRTPRASPPRRSASSTCGCRRRGRRPRCPCA